MHCSYCNKDGHTIDRCYCKKKNKRRQESQEAAELVMISIDGVEGQTFHKELTFFHKVENSGAKYDDELTRG